MSQIYRLFMVRGWKDAFYSLSKDQQNELQQKLGQALNAAGGKTVVMCDMRWATDGVIYGVEVYPDIEAVQKHDRLLNEFHWSRYVDQESFLGTAWQSL